MSIVHINITGDQRIHTIKSETSLVEAKNSIVRNGWLGLTAEQKDIVSPLG